MASPVVLRRLTWQAGRVVEAVPESVRVKTLIVDLPEWPGHRAGQHIDVRLTADDGYQAVRSYSIASPPEEKNVVVTIERLDNGEVSPYLVDEVRADDQLEFRGPIGGYFVWSVALGGPLMLVGGGSGIVPLMAMLRHRIAAGSDVPVRLLYSTRSPDEVIYRAELDRLSGEAEIDVIHTYTRMAPDGWTGYSRRVDMEMLREIFWPPHLQPLAYVCGPTGFVEAVAGNLLMLGHKANRIRTERFGPTGR